MGEGLNSRNDWLLFIFGYDIKDNMPAFNFKGYHSENSDGECFKHMVPYAAKYPFRL